MNHVSTHPRSTFDERLRKLRRGREQEEDEATKIMYERNRKKIWGWRNTGRRKSTGTRAID